MDIVKHLSSIEIPTDNKEKLLQFVIEKESDLKVSILKMWDDFVLDSSAKSDIIENDNLPVIEVVSEEKKTVDISSSSVVNNNTMENSTNPMVEFNAVNPIIILEAEEKKI